MRDAAGGEAAAMLVDRIVARDEAVSDYLRALPARLAALAAGARAQDAVIVLGEVLNNVVEHAYRGRADGEVRLSIEVDGTALAIETRDRGAPRPPAMLAGAALPGGVDDPDVDALPEGGFGLFLIHALATDMSYERAGGVNALRFRLRDG